MTQTGAVYNGRMRRLGLFRKARILLVIFLCAACTPAWTPTGVTPLNGVAPAVAPEQATNSNVPLPPGEARIYATQVALPTYPLERYRSVAFDPVYRWPYFRFDRERFRQEAPPAEIRHYQLLVLENEYLEVTILPELGGRIWQVVHKPTGDTMFYQNSVIKPSPWGPASQLGWLAVGGLEWALPVNEHGYDWGTGWQVTTFQDEDGSAGARIATPADGRLLAAEIVVKVHPDHAYVMLAPTIHNLADYPLDFHFWQTAMLAPGPGNALSADLRFVSPSPIMTIHSTGDTMLPGPGQLITWPHYFGRDLSRLGNWDRYVGIFEFPTARGPFVGVYDPQLDAGAVRIYPAQIAQGSKVFGLGWRNAIHSEDFTDDGSAYVELHGGLSPTFDQPYRLAGGASVSWEEQWYPVAGIGNMVYANQAAALNLARTTQGVQIALYPTSALTGSVKVVVEQVAGDAVAVEFPIHAAPDQPFVRDLETVPSHAALTIRLFGPSQELLLEYSAKGGLWGRESRDVSSPSGYVYRPDGQGE